MYHVNDKGESNKCSAKEPSGCQFYKGEDDARHYETLTEARAGAETIMAKETGNALGTLKKKKNELDMNFGTVDKKDRAQKIIENLDKAIENIVSDGKLGTYLDAMSRNGANKWSFSNVVIAGMQLQNYQKRNGLPVEKDIVSTLNKMDACGAKQWNERGRKITSGKGSALYILAPMIGKKDAKDSNGNPVIGKDGKPSTNSYVYGFRTVPVFDVSQTEGDPVPENPIEIKPVTQEIDDKYVDDMKNMIEKSGYKYHELEIASNPEKLEGTLGYTRPSDMTVAVDSRLSKAQKAAVISHELAHIKLGHVSGEGLDEYKTHRGRMETEAESLSYMLMQRAGLDEKQGESFSPGYIAGWAKGDMKVVRAALNKVTSNFGKIMDEMKWD